MNPGDSAHSLAGAWLDVMLLNVFLGDLERLLIPSSSSSSLVRFLYTSVGEDPLLGPLTSSTFTLWSVSISFFQRAEEPARVALKHVHYIVVFHQLLPGERVSAPLRDLLVKGSLYVGLLAGGNKCVDVRVLNDERSVE